MICACMISVCVGVCAHTCMRVKNETEEQKGEKMSLSNKAAGVKCWRLLHVCA